MTRRAAATTYLFAALIALASCGSAADQPLPARIDAVFREAHADGEFNGSVLVTRGDQPIYQTSFGLADHARNIANTADTKFLARFHRRGNGRASRAYSRDAAIRCGHD